jgi:hypothetical protein
MNPPRRVLPGRLRGNRAAGGVVEAIPAVVVRQTGAVERTDPVRMGEALEDALAKRRPRR